MKKLLAGIKSETLLLLLILAFMVGLLMLQTSPLTTLPSRDSGFFMYAGKQILAGKLPYIDFWDSKGPGIFYINALGLLLGKGYRWGVWLLEYFFLLVSSYLFYQSSALKWGHGAALLSNAAWLYGLSHVWEGGNLTEEYSLLFSFILLSYFLQVDGTLRMAFSNRARKSSNGVQNLQTSELRENPRVGDLGLRMKTDNHLIKLSLLLGATFVLSFLFRANNIGTQISLLAALMLSSLLQRHYKQAIKILGWTIVSGGVILGLVSIYFLYTGIFSKMFEAAVLYNFFYAGAKDHFQLNLWQGIQKIGLPAYLALSGYLAILYQIVRKKLDFSTPLTLFLLFSFPVEIFLSSLSGKNYFHYFISWMPAIAILVALAYAAFSKEIFSAQFIEIFNQRRKNHLFALAILFFVYIVTGASRDYQDIAKRILFERGQGIEKTDPVANFIRANTTRDDLVLVWGAYPGLNFLAKRDAPTPFLFYPAYAESPFSAEMGAAYYQSLLSNPPKIIVDASSISPDYILSLDALARATQLEYNPVRIYQPPYQNNVFQLVERAYYRLNSINGMDIYILAVASN